MLPPLSTSIGSSSSPEPAHHSILGDDQAADVVGGHSADGVVHGGALVDLVVDVEVARLLPRVLRCAHVCRRNYDVVRYSNETRITPPRGKGGGE